MKTIKKLIYRLFEFLFNRWTKWERIAENMPMTEVTYAPPAFGTFYEANRTRVFVDVYCRENKFTGIKRYKRVKRYG